ncbi:2-phosphosulfolactate phosphatase [Streptomyces sp. NPDC048604]|uniref:2-phosphosulfolactate phosphatase n=1 Tax=Streptomyces sp. NPDC048604 TaxID=3365578 RepID=UPI003715742B
MIETSSADGADGHDGRDGEGAWFAQRGHGVRFDWGLAGARRLAPEAACLVVVDVLSFTTSVTVAVDAGTRVFPYPWRDGTEAAYAARVDAELAVGRRAVSADRPWSLSPAALRKAPATPRLVLPSPNGSTIAAAAADGGAAVVAGCLRNARAVGDRLAAQGYGTPERPVVVIAAGEHWPDGSLRPALEDLLGAGAVVAALRAAGAGPASPEAEATRLAHAPTPDVAGAVTACASGLELSDDGFGADVAVATELDATGAVPILKDGAFTGL